MRDSEPQQAPGDRASPLVSVGMPVYDGQQTIEVAMAAVLAQTFSDLELIVSDNASTDATPEICERIARSDPRVRVIRQERNAGRVSNFQAVLRAARAPYFMFAAADDRVERHFIAECLEILENSPGAVACTPRTLFYRPDGEVREAEGSVTIAGPDWLRPARFFMKPADNSRIYGLYKTPVMRAAYLGADHHAWDWTVSGLTLAQGSHVQSTSVVLHRGAPPVRDHYFREHRAAARDAFDGVFPVGRMSLAVVARLSPAQLIPAIPALLFLNLRKCVEQLRALLREWRGARKKENYSR